MRPLIPIALCIILFAACNNNKSILSKYFTPDNLPEQTFSINTQRDTTVITKQGIKINIPANAIESGSNNATLVIKEALALEDMLKAGLTTTTGKELLASDGMFYIGTKEKTAIKKPLHIYLPTTAADKNMQLYKGVEEDGKIDWQAPENMDKPITNITDTGEKIFKENCTSCHAVDKQITGPALAWEDKHRPMQWVRDFTRSNFKLLASRDKYACCIYNKYKSSMTDFTNILSDKQIDAIYRYIDKASKERGIPEPAGYRLSACDSCYYYKDYFYRLAEVKDSLMKENGAMVNIDITPPKGVYYITDTIVDNLVSQPDYNAEYYQFDITAFGWLNVDALISGFPNLAQSNLKVKLNNAGTGRMEVFMIVPEYKVFQRGGLLDDGESFGFYKTDGTVNLMQGLNTIVFAVGEEKGKMYFGETAFAATLSQNINIDVHESTKSEIERFFKNAHAEKIKMKVAKTKNYKSIKAIDNELGDAKRIVENCSCSYGTDTTTVK